MPSSLDHIDDYDLGTHGMEEGQTRKPFRATRPEFDKDNQLGHHMLHYFVSCLLLGDGPDAYDAH
jgi:hypothetical protein